MTGRRGWGWPLVPVYWAGLRVKDGLRALGVLRVRRLGWPVVSVGSLSAGGAGKTPVVIALAELLKGRGWGVDVLSRGYGRGGGGVERVDVGVEGAAARFGDEPVLIARRVGVEVWVGAGRYEVGRVAEGYGAREENAGVLRSAQNDKAGDGDVGQSARGGSDRRRVHLLDDGFQHRHLARVMDVVVVTAEDLEDVLLPAGNLREPLVALRRADAVVVREAEWERIEGRVRGLVREGAEVWRVRRGLGFVRLKGKDLAQGAQREGSQGAQRKGESEEITAGLSVVAFCGIARPEGFAAMLEEAGCGVVEMVAFGDHHRYAMGDVERLVRLAGACGGTGFVTTEKDAVKLTGAMLARLREVGPVVVARLETRFVDEAAVVRAVEARIA